MDVTALPATELASEIRDRQLSPVEAVDAFAAKIEERNSARNAIVYVDIDAARDRAKDAEQAVIAGYPLPPLHGVPTAVKDLCGCGDTVGPSEIDGFEVEPLMGWALTVVASMTGHPAASVPVGMTASGTPVAMQIIGRRFGDGDVLA